MAFLRLRSTSSEPKIVVVTSSHPEVHHDYITNGSASISNYTPLFLRSWTLSVLAIFFLSVAATVLLLWNLARKADGFVLISTNHYLWTYGPTAVLVVVVAAWRQVDFFCKTVTPWWSLKRKYSGPAGSIFLDYLSPLQMVSLWQALRHRHLLVALTIVGFLILKLITLASTGLLVATPVTTLPRSADAIQTSALQAPPGNNTVLLGLYDKSIAYTAFATANKELPYSAGTTETFAYETFELLPGSVQGDYTAETDLQAFIPEYQCRQIPITIHQAPSNTTDTNPENSIELLDPACRFETSSVGILSLNPQKVVCPPRQLKPLLLPIDCSGSDAETGERQDFLALIDFRYNQSFSSIDTSFDPPIIKANSWSTTVNQAIAIACRPGYRVGKVRVSLLKNASEISTNAMSISTDESLTLIDFTSIDLDNIVNGGLAAATSMFGNVVDNEAALEYPHTLFKMMSSLSDHGYESLLNPMKMISQAEKTLNGLSIQVAAGYLLHATQIPRSASVTQTCNRLKINSLPSYIMVSGCVFMAAAAAMLALCRPASDLSSPPENPSTIAMMVARSSNFNTVVAQNRPAMSAGQDGTMENYCYSTIPDVEVSHSEALTISLVQNSVLLPQTCADQSRVRNDESKWWLPITATKSFVIVVLVTTLCAAAMLQLLQQRSDQSLGFANFQNHTSTTTVIVTRFLPALIVFIIATLVNSLDFNVAILAPFHALRTHPLSATPAITKSLIGQPPPALLWSSVKQKQWGPACSTIATLAGSLLAIAVSGLITVEQFPTSLTVPIHIQDKFAPDWIDSAIDDQGAAIVTSLTESLNLAYPPFTFDYLAIPTVTFQSNLSTTWSQRTAQLQIQVNSLRASLECTVLTSDTSQVNVRAVYNSRILSASSTVDVQYELPRRCQFGGFGGNLSVLDFSYTFPLPNNASYIGKLLDLHVGPYSPILASSDMELVPNIQQDNPPGCPSLGFVFGFSDADNISSNSVSVLVCSQYLEQLTTNITLSQPQMAVTASEPPTVDENSLKRLNSSAQGDTAFQFRIQSHFDDVFSSFNPSAQNESSDSSTSSPPLDNFFVGILRNQSSLPTSSLADFGATQTVQNAIQDLYRKYMAQAISLNMRVPFSSTNNTTTYTQAPFVNGTLVNAVFNTRLVQDKTSKIVLQILLTTMFLFSALAMYFTRLHHLVPVNPCCIVGVSALFAGSDMCNPLHDTCKALMPPGVEGMTERELEKFWSGWRFQLKWWGDRYGIDAVKVGEDEI